MKPIVSVTESVVRLVSCVVRANVLHFQANRETQILAGYPLKEKSSVCVMCLKYRIMILIIIIISR